jgi:hypothetical protein
VSATDGAWLLQYEGAHGWWTGHHGIDLKDPAAYVAGVNKRPGFNCRVINKDTGEIIGDQRVCGLCGDPHDGVEGSCLL